MPGTIFHAIGQVAPNCTVWGSCTSCKRRVEIKTTFLELPPELIPVEKNVLQPDPGTTQ